MSGRTRESYIAKEKKKNVINMADPDGTMNLRNRESTCEFYFVSVEDIIKKEHASEASPTQTIEEEWPPSTVPLGISVKEEPFEDKLLGNIANKKEPEDNCVPYTIKVEPSDEVSVEDNKIDIGDGLNGSSTYCLGGGDPLNETCKGEQSTDKSSTIILGDSTGAIENENGTSRAITYHGKQHARRGRHAEKPYRCHKCGQSYNTRSKLLYHIQIHSDVRPHVCKECGKCFTIRRYLTIHMKFHLVQKPHVCNECGKGFTYQTRLIEHSKIHSGERPYICSHCGKGFRTSNHLTVHFKIHSGEKPHVCKECGKGFISSSHLKSHLKWHSGERSLECDACGRCFSHRSNLISHIKVHSGQRVHVRREYKKTSTASSTNLQGHSGQRYHIFSDYG